MLYVSALVKVYYTIHFMGQYNNFNMRQTINTINQIRVYNDLDFNKIFQTVSNIKMLRTERFLKHTIFC